MQKKYLISIDLDGTLLNDKRKIPFKTRWYLRSLARRGHVVFINTGRPLSGAMKSYKSLRIRKYPLSIINGASLVYVNKKGEIEKEISNPINLKILKDFLKDVNKFIKDAILVSNRKHYIYRSREIPPFIKKYHHPKRIDFIESFEEINDEILAFSLSSDAINHEEIAKILQLDKYQHFSSYTWGIKEKSKFISYQLTNANHTKSWALKKMQELYNIDSSHVISFGDSYNDIEMLKDSHLGVTMKNGRNEMVMSATTLSKKDNNHQGVYHYLKAILKIK